MRLIDADELLKWISGQSKSPSCPKNESAFGLRIMKHIDRMPSVQPEIVRCCKCSFWDRDTLSHQFNDFRDWNEAECKILAERDPYCEINRYTEADDFCSYAERRTDGTD